MAERATPVTYLATTRFWFEYFQNWQSEFMSVGALVVLSIFLREKGSPESKPIDHPHAETGSEQRLRAPDRSAVALRVRSDRTIRR